MGRLQDLSRKVFGSFTVLKRADDVIYPSKSRPEGQKVTAWVCQCECGNTRVVPGVKLRGRKTTSCGCMYIQKRMNKLVGKKFGRLVVLGRAPDKNKHSRWICKCNCGRETVVFVHHLRSGVTKSCGCLWEERRLERGLSIKRSKYRLAKIKALKYRGRVLAFNLSFDEFVKLSESPCAYCGKPPSKIQKNKNYYGEWTCSGIDRVDSSIGYVTENCVPCCEPCNQAKNDRTVDEFLNHARRIVQYQGGLVQAYDDSKERQA